MRKIPVMAAGQVCTEFAGRKVFVYFNLHKKLWSVKDCQSGRVLCHAHNVQVMQAVGKVSEAGRQRVLREKRKNVHAGIVGVIPSFVVRLDITTTRYLTYNPYKYDSFVYKDDEGRFDGADYVSLVNGRVFAGCAERAYGLEIA